MLELVGQMVDGVGKLVTQHIALAKLEIAEELRGLGRDVGKVAAFVKPARAGLHIRGKNKAIE